MPSPSHRIPLVGRILIAGLFTLGGLVYLLKQAVIYYLKLLLLQTHA